MGLFDSFKQMISPDEQPKETCADESTRQPPVTRPQDGVPAEQIVHYIVKDYQRMWHAFHRYKTLAEATKEQIEARAKKIAQQREGDRPAEITNLQNVLQERNNEIENLKANIAERNEKIKTLRETRTAMKEQIRQHEDMMELQRTQIRTLMEKLEDLESNDRDKESAWHIDRWKAAIEQTDKLQKQLTTVRGIVTAQSLEREQMNVITNLIEDCKRQTVRIYESIAHTAPSKVRMAYKATKESK